MSTNPYPPLPRDQGMNPMQDLPAPIVAKARYASENSTASSVISVSANTTTLEVAAVGGPAVVRWIATTDTQASVVSAASGANFDHVVPTATVRRFAIPIESFVAQSSIVGKNAQNGLYQRVAIKSIGVASVLLSEF